MTPAVQRVIDEADRRAADKAAMPARCPTPTECRRSACHGGCLEPSEPVALEMVYETIIHWDEGGGKRSRRELARRIVALYGDVK